MAKDKISYKDLLEHYASSPARPRLAIVSRDVVFDDWTFKAGVYWMDEKDEVHYCTLKEYFSGKQ
jgi:hypothetical protein